MCWSLCSLLFLVPVLGRRALAEMFESIKVTQCIINTGYRLIQVILSKLLTRTSGQSEGVTLSCSVVAT